MLLLRAKDIENLAEPSVIMKAVKEAMQCMKDGDYVVPERMHADFKGNTLLLMPSFSHNVFSTKLVSIFPENKKQGKPAIQGLVVLNNGETGEPLAILEGAKLTAIRTAGVSSFGLSLLQKKPAKSLGLVGAGVQGLHQLIFASKILKPEQINIYDPYSNNIDAFVNSLKTQSGVQHIEIKKTNIELCAQSEIIITATSSNKPVLPAKKELLKNKIIVAIGSYKPDMHELPDVFFDVVDKIYVDTLHAIHESGDLLIPIKNKKIWEKEILPISTLISADKNNHSKAKTILYKTVGSGLFDLFVANALYKKATENKTGIEISL